MATIRIAVVLSGGASLGAYQAGAMAALLVAVQDLRERGLDVAVDALGGASAGALVALLGGHALQEGRDPIVVLHEAWVERVELDLLLGGADAPLTFDALREHVEAVLDPGPQERRTEPQDLAVMLHVALTNLQGLRYPIRSVRGEQPVLATTYADWSQFVLEPAGGAEQIVEPQGAAPIDVALASAANPGAFSPRLLDRSELEQGYRDRGIVDFPDSGYLWYSDGGLLQSEPVGRVLSAVDDDTAIRRLALLIDPRSEGPSGSDRFTDPEADLRWLAGLGRALSIIPAQVLYDDLRRIERDNTRLAWTERFVETVAPLLSDDAVAALDEVVLAIDADREDLQSGGSHHERDRSDHDAATLLRTIAEEIAGLAGKRAVEVDVISPLLLADGDESVPGLLAGEFLGDFGGFLSQDLRHSDFVLGYDSTQRWLEQGLPGLDLDGQVVEEVAEVVASRRLAPWREENVGEAELSDLSWEARLTLAKFGGHILRVVTTELVRIPAQLTGRLERVRAAARRVLPW